MRWPPEKQRRVLERLDSVERSVVGVSRVLLRIALAGVLAVVAAVIVTRKPGGNTQGEYYYFGVAAVIVVGWILAQLGRLRSRERQAEARRRFGGEGAPGPTMRYSHDTHPLEGDAGFVRSMEFGFGSGPDADTDAEVPRPAGAKSFTFSRGFEVPLASLPVNVMPDDATLDVIAAALERGESLELLCAAVQPAWADWNMLERQAYRFLLEAKLEERVRRGGRG